MPLINITLSDQMKSFMDERHYDPNEIDDLALAPTTNGEVTWYVDGTNGDDSYDGLYPDTSLGGSHGPFRTFARSINGNYPHRYGERVLIRTGFYEVPNGSTIGMNLTGTQDDDHYFIIGPYGDGEVVFDFSSTNLYNPSELLTGTIYKKTFIAPGFIFNPSFVVMDWDMRTSRRANGRYGSDNSGVDDKTTSMTDTSRDFTFNQCEQSAVAINAVGAMIYNASDKSYGFVTSLSTTTNPNDTLNFSGGLTGGTNNKFNNGDSYALIHFDDNGDWFHMEHKKVIHDNSGINNKTTYTVDTTKSFDGYENGVIFNTYAFGLITSISTTTNTNDTINFSKGMNGLFGYVNNDWGRYQWQKFHAVKKIQGTDITGIATGHYNFADQSLTDTTKDFSGYEGALILNETTGAYSLVTQVATKTNPNDSIITGAKFNGGTSQYTSSGDAYRIYKLESSYDHLFIKSTTGNPDNRNIRISPSNDSGKGITVFNQYIKFYGMTFIGAPEIGVWFFDSHGRVDKCRFMFCGKHALQGGFRGTTPSNYFEFTKVFVYQNVLMNWPRGRTWGAGGGWPQSIQMGSREGGFYNGCVIYDNGGEGVGGCDTLENCIVIDNYSFNIYFESSHITVRNNVAGQFSYRDSDFYDPYYFQDSYNSIARNTQKMHSGGITMGAEVSGTLESVTDVKIYNNIVIGGFTGIGQYFEWSPNGLTNSFIANNTIILPSDEITPLFEPYAGITIRPSSVDVNAFIKNNIIIGAIYPVSGGIWGEAERMNLFRCRNNGFTTANIDCNKNLYSYPLEPTPFTLTTDSSINPSNFTQWKAFTGWDANTPLTDTPGLVGSNTQWLTIGNIHKKHLKLLSSSVGIGTGEDLSAYFTTDFDGNTRTTWDKGAMIYSPTDEDFTKEAVTSLGATDADLATDFFPVEYDYLESIDNRTAEVTATNKYGVFLLKTRSSVGQPPISIKWVGKTNIPGSTSTIYLQIYNRNSTTWETLTSNATVAANTQFTMTASIGTNLSNYYDGDNIIACRIYQLAAAV